MLIRFWGDGIKQMWAVFLVFRRSCLHVQGELSNYHEGGDCWIYETLPIQSITYRCSCTEIGSTAKGHESLRQCLYVTLHNLNDVGKCISSPSHTLMLSSIIGKYWLVNCIYVKYITGEFNMKILTIHFFIIHVTCYWRKIILKLK
jgi:hypothetical protein